ncbi:hypothetical protein ABZ318_35785 [Streptomyces sp. NPDC006197]|uniref:hypothetical protein n=1 Tax=Streptomyces sp. NPDC006197 TaxID=3156685 RepID=UPI0033BEE64A
MLPTSSRRFWSGPGPRPAAIRARAAETLEAALAALGVAAMVFVMSDDGRFHRRHLFAEARRFLALAQRGRRREAGLDEQIVDAGSTPTAWPSAS